VEQAVLRLRPVSFAEAAAFVRRHHRHHRPPPGSKFCVGVAMEERRVGVIIAGRPVARPLDDGGTLEVTRCCTDGTPHAGSCLYGAAWRSARALGYRQLLTYTLTSEPGTSLKAAGWRQVGETKGGRWNCPSRPRADSHPTGPKRRWEVAAE
jgi:hypothetical protein